MTLREVGGIVEGAGGNLKKRFEWGRMGNGERALRTSQGRSKSAGATSDYIARINTPGILAHGTSLGNARRICASGLSRVGRLHVHLGRLVGSRPVGIRPGSEVGIIIDGDRCTADGMAICESSNRVTLTEGINGITPLVILPKQLRYGQGRYCILDQEDGWGIHRKNDRIQMSLCQQMAMAPLSREQIWVAKEKPRIKRNQPVIDDACG